MAALLQGANTTDGKREEEWKEKPPGSDGETNTSSRFLLVVEQTACVETA